MRTLRALPRAQLVGFDLNGVLCTPNPRLAEEAHQRFGVTVEDWSRYDAIAWALEAHGVKEARSWIKRRVNDPGFILDLAPEPELQRAWHDISLEKRVVTGHWAVPETMAATEAWLRKHGFLEKGRVRCDFVKAKAGWVRQTRASFLVDDSPVQALEAAEAGCLVLLVDRPYNTNVVDDRVARVTPETIGKEIAWQTSR